ncbi:conserved exported protein of unknown function [Bradyrhizobium sp. ORS 285]|uniref:DUF3617 domain-containing protein n=1 Tax=Bradyrhizobium sp. ORS 285 TaxID=115808 RepID=UPI000240ABDC|nr:DUF3617 family protein [Bradyrhizobium sp. ORS 285]CCD87645.1 conserved exported hypothetical protein [Bradyrhizobium sp. ORS 285]SMX60780.1 conserved exported protein of unknown function [Bradyrhizobium sp. ORS 285]
MTRTRTALGLLACCLLSVAANHEARAVDLPVRKAGLWELKMVRSGGQTPDMTMQHCTDEATDKDMNNMASPMAQQVCSKQEIQKTATGYVSDAVCNFGGMSTTSHAEITGDFNSAYTVKTTSKMSGGATGAGTKDTAMTIEAKWLGACKPDQKPGDIVMPGGMKMNVKDMNKLKNLIPGVKQ